MLRGVALTIWALSAAGCSVALPLSGGKTDDIPTGSIDRAAGTLSPSPGRDDLRRARAAMAVALDPQGDGARAAWRDPQSGAHGAFAAAGPPYADHDRVCRHFTGELAPAGGAERRLRGSACRDGDGSWAMLPGEDGRA